MAIGDSALARLRVLDQVGGVEAHEIDVAELAQRMPLLAGYSGPAVPDESGGAIRTRTAITALAGALADAVTTAEVISIDPRADGTVEVRSVTDRAVYPKVVVCAGRETARLARSVGLSLPVRLAAHVRLTFDVKAAAPARVACLQDSSGVFGEVGRVRDAATGQQQLFGRTQRDRRRPRRRDVQRPCGDSIAGRTRANT